jgi:exodeoxyribonuclease-5
MNEWKLLNSDQQSAIEDIILWLSTDSPYYVLSGAAGTGKTYTLRELLACIPGQVVVTAPTNKATRVLRETLTSEDYTPICRTTYSLLGLRLTPDGEIKRLTSPEDPVDLKSLSMVVIDEASMVNQQLMVEIEKATQHGRLKILFLGDPNQLPPVKEGMSPVWKLTENKSDLQKVMRFDNQILVLANRIKEVVNHPAPSIKLTPDNNCIEGVWLENKGQFIESIMRSARLGNFADTSSLTKAIAWRNATVAELNSLIRRQIFDNSEESKWFIGDRIILTAPASDFEGYSIGCTDDEGTISRVEIAPHPIHGDFQCFNLSVITDENKRIDLWLLHPDSEFEFRLRANNLANDARLWSKKWKAYWEFMESFHQAQHGYAITAHRAQGSTYNTCYVAWTDILANRNRNEAFRCLYVAVTRPRKKLILGSW